MYITTAVLLLNRKKVSVMGLDAPFILFPFNLILLTKGILWDRISSYQVRHKFQQYFDPPPAGEMGCKRFQKRSEKH